MRKNDFLLIGIILILALAVSGYHFLKKDSGAGKVVVTVDGDLYGEYDLSKDQTIDIEGMNTLQIEDNEARMASATCPDKLCVHQRAISRAGESIICLPNKVVVTIEGGEKQEVDAISN
ncbi:MAG: NusG domain II-containing protein [Muricomes sp.]